MCLIFYWAYSLFVYYLLFYSLQPIFASVCIDGNTEIDFVYSRVHTIEQIFLLFRTFVCWRSYSVPRTVDELSRGYQISNNYSFLHCLKNFDVTSLHPSLTHIIISKRVFYLFSSSGNLHYRRFDLFLCESLWFRRFCAIRCFLSSCLQITWRIHHLLTSKLFLLHSVVCIRLIHWNFTLLFNPSTSQIGWKLRYLNRFWISWWMELFISMRGNI